MKAIRRITFRLNKGDDLLKKVMELSQEPASESLKDTTVVLTDDKIGVRVALLIGGKNSNN